MADLISQSTQLPSLTLNDRQLQDLELLMVGAFSPLTGYLRQTDYQKVLSDMRLSSGEIWTIPITLGIKEEEVASFQENNPRTLQDNQNTPLALVSEIEIYPVDLVHEIEVVYGKDTLKDGKSQHSYINYLLSQGYTHYIGVAAL